MLNIRVPARSEIMTVAKEFVNRRKCRYRLAGVLIAVDGRGDPIPVAHTYWGKDSQLVVVLEGGWELPPERCHLRSVWPIACCQPKKRNEWNTAR
jgi:hypothetical protein